MPTAVSPNPRTGASAPDDLDNLLDYDNAVQDFWKDLPEANNNSKNTENAVQPANDIDEEVRVTKKRKPNPKLDDARLLSDAGISKLRRIAKDRLKFKGKGHEFSDISRMLNLYQLWLDDLYPKAKFRDGLAMVEKLGHSKRMQVSRRAWMDETKALRRREDEEMLNAEADGSQDDADYAIFGDQTEQQAPPKTSGDAPEDDELDALFAEESGRVSQAASGAPPKRNGPFEDDNNGPDEDELDDLMAENAAPATTKGPASAPPKPKGPFDEDDESDQDELDALLNEEQQQRSGTDHSRTTSVPKTANTEDNFAAEEEAMAEMGDFW